MSGRYRRGVGVMLLNRAGQVFVGARIDNTDEAWQMPQGGIDKGEKPWDCALREVEEETGIGPQLLEQVACHPQRLRYDLPPELAGKLWKGRYAGQRQSWFLMRFRGSDADVNLDTEHPEFRAFQWIDPWRLPDLIVAFKKPLYEEVLAEFAGHLPSRP